MNFKGWYEIEQKNKEGLDLYCKAQLKRMGLKPHKDAIPEFHNVRVNCKWKNFEFYHLNDTVEIKKRSKTIIEELTINPENLCKSLYILNKSAKKSRDSKNLNYYNKNFGIVSRCKNRQIELYELKNKVMDKMIADNILELKGYHIQNVNNPVYLLLYAYDNYCFHIIDENKKFINDLEYLGNINNLISAESKIKINIKFGEAVNLLKRYLEI